MKLIERTVLALCDTDEGAAFVKSSFAAKLKSVFFVKTPKEAIVKASNQEFDLFLIQSAKPVLTNPQGFYVWAQGQKKLRHIPWVVVGTAQAEDKTLIENSPLVKFLADGAVDQIDSLLASLLPEKAAQTSAEIDVNFINPVAGAVVEVLKSMGQVDLTRGKPFVRKVGETIQTLADVSGIVAMNSDKFLGSFAICFQEKLALKIYENMVGAPVTSLNDEIKDAVGELTNIVFGNAKRDLNAIGHTIGAAIPSVVAGKNHEIRHSVRGTGICIPFESPYGTVTIECVISPHAAAAKKAA